MLADGCVAEIEDAELGTIRTLGISYKLETSPGQVGGCAPRAGEHTDAVRAEAEQLAPARATPASGQR